MRAYVRAYEGGCCSKAARWLQGGSNIALYLHLGHLVNQLQINNNGVICLQYSRCIRGRQLIQSDLVASNFQGSISAVQFAPWACATAPTSCNSQWQAKLTINGSKSGRDCETKAKCQIPCTAALHRKLQLTLPFDWQHCGPEIAGSIAQ